MEEKEKIAIAQDWVRQLANGVNPLNGNVLKEDDVVNNVHISRCLFYVADLLGKYSERTKKPTSLRNMHLQCKWIDTTMRMLYLYLLLLKRLRN